MKELLFISVMCGGLFAGNWVEVSHRGGVILTIQYA